MADRKVKLALGFKGERKEVEVNLPDDEPTPWDLDTKLSVAGQSHARLDAVAKVTGKAKYTFDINLPGMLYGGFWRSPCARGRVKAIDTSEAEKVPGVVAVSVDIPEFGLKPIRYAGQPFVAVVAESRQALEAGIEKVKVDYESAPHVARMDQALAEDAPRVAGNRPNASEPKPHADEERVGEALAAAEKNAEGARKVSAVCTTQVQNHCALESHGVVAKWDDEHLTMWASTQSTFGVRDQLAEVLKVPVSQITVITEYMGGGFGAKFSLGYWGLAAAILARTTKRPVKFMLDRRAEMTDTGNRPNSVQEMDLAIGADGKLGAYRLRVQGTPGVGRAGRLVANPLVYRFPEKMVDKTESEVLTNAGEQQAFRAPGHPQGSFAMETIMDLAAEAMAMDPLEFRMKNDPNPVRQAQFKDGAERIGWRNRQANGSAKGRFRRGLGVAAATWFQLGGGRADVECRIHRDGSVELRNGAQDIGTGTRTIIAVVGAEELGLPLERVRVALGNTADGYGPGSGGSTTAPTIMPAVRQAAFLAGRDLRELVSKHLQCNPGDLVFRGGKVESIKEDGKSMPFAEACRLIDTDMISQTGKRKRNIEAATYRGGVAGVQFADVEVDCDFGIVRVKKVVAIQDAGIILDRLTAESQVLGGVIQGLSYALFEERHMDRHLGHQVNADMEMYKILGPADMPEIECVLYDVANGANNTSTAGIGEPTMVPTAAAVAGAVHNAIGARVKSLPITPDRVLAALGKGTKEAGK